MLSLSIEGSTTVNSGHSVVSSISGTHPSTLGHIECPRFISGERKDLVRILNVGFGGSFGRLKS